MFSRREKEAEKLAALAEARRREDAAPRLRDVVPKLRALRLRLEDRRLSGQSSSPPYTRHVMVATGPALFSVRCTEPRCTGTHEITDAILAALRQSLPRSAGESACPGGVGSLPCDRTLVYSCEAEFHA